MKIGYVGLGKMGKNMVLHLLEGGIEVVAWNRSSEPVEEVVKAGAIGAESIEELVLSLRGTNVTKQSNKDDGVVIWLMLPAGDITDEYIDKLIPLLEKGDLVIEGGNSFYKDSLRRGEKLGKSGVHFMDIGTSGGPNGARAGACLMIGGSDEDFNKIEELAKKIAAPGAFQHVGPVGAGHFAKMVHNAIEYGMMESIGEGLAILKNSQFDFDFVKVLNIYNNKSVIDSRLVGWTLDAFKEDADLSETSSVIGSGGGGKERIKAEGDWTVDIAKEWGIDIPAIENAMIVRTESAKVPEDSPNGFRNKVVAAIRGQFGHFDVKKS